MHGDHYFGLIGLISSMHLLGREKELHIYAHPKIKSIIDIQLDVSSTEFCYPLFFHPITPDIDEVLFVKPDYLLSGTNQIKFFISAKVSIRERWIQADWEAIKYKEKYPNAFCVLIMNDKFEYPAFKNTL